MSRVFVLASINMDMFLRVDAFVRPGETVNALSVERLPGGKGFNQAVGAARMGASTVLLGAVGDDPDGRTILDEAAREENLDLSRVHRVNEYMTSVAMIQIDDSKDNAIVVAPGANLANDVSSLGRRIGDLGPGDVLVCQLELPVATVAAGLGAARQAGATTILNAAPAMPVSDLLGDVDLLIVNETEAATLLGAGREDAARALHHEFGIDVIVTLGSSGAHVVTSDTDVQLSAIPTEVADTTGAGDAFVGAVAAVVAEGRSIPDAAEYGTVLASFACRSKGAQGYPQRRPDVEELLDSYRREASCTA